MSLITIIRLVANVFNSEIGEITMFFNNFLRLQNQIYAILFICKHDVVIEIRLQYILYITDCIEQVISFAF